MGKVVYFGLFFLGCFVFGSSGVPVEGASDDQPGAKSPCPSGSVYFGKYCYEYFENHVTWDKAETECQNLRHDSHLTSFSSLREEKVVSAYVRSHSSTNYVWIGLYSVPRYNKLYWAWSDNTPYISGSSLWDKRSPSTSTSNNECVCLYNIQYPSYSSRWSQYNCESSWPYVCKYKP